MATATKTEVKRNTAADKLNTGRSIKSTARPTGGKKTDRKKPPMSKSTNKKEFSINKKKFIKAVKTIIDANPQTSLQDNAPIKQANKDYMR